MVMQILRTSTPDHPPPALAEGQLAVEMASNPPRLWVGVPTSIDPSGRRQITAARAPWRTGDIKLTYKTVAAPGWIMCNDSTIGDVGSGANFQHADAEKLFVLLFNKLADNVSPLLTSAGAATNRASLVSGASAWVMHCRITLARMLGRALAVAGQGAGLAHQNLGSFGGAENVALSVGQLASHSHIYSPHWVLADHYREITNAWHVNGAGAVNPTGGNAGHNNVQPTGWLNAMIHL